MHCTSFYSDALHKFSKLYPAVLTVLCVCSTTALCHNNNYCNNRTCPGADCTEPVTSEQIARATVATLEKVVPAAVPGIMFLSGGMSEEEASLNLNTMNSFERRGPWSLSFSYGRALQQSCLKAWQGKKENVGAAQAALMARAQANSEANLGKYKAGSQPSDDQTLFVKGYKY